MSISFVDVVLLALVMLALLGLLGALREVTYMRSEFRALSNVLLEPEEPPELGQNLPRSVVELLARRGGSAALVNPHHLIYMSATCGTCRQFSSKIARLLDRGEIGTDSFTFVLPERQRDTSLAKRIINLDLPLAFDHGQRTAADLAVDAVPTVVGLDVTNHTVMSYRAGAEPDDLVLDDRLRHHTGSDE